jgi:hypothetical protein
LEGQESSEPILEAEDLRGRSREDPTDSHEEEYRQAGDGDGEDQARPPAQDQPPPHLRRGGDVRGRQGVSGQQEEDQDGEGAVGDGAKPGATEERERVLQAGCEEVEKKDGNRRPPADSIDFVDAPPIAYFALIENPPMRGGFLPASRRGDQASTPR